MILSSFSLAGKTALVTGCRRGIGRGIVLGLAEAGADIVGVSSVMEASGGEVGERIRKLGRTFRGYACDLSNRKSLGEFVQRVKGEAGGIDILINNAGIVRRQAAVEHSDGFWDEVVEVNLRAPFVLAREFGREMVGRGRGKIVFIASLAAMQGGMNSPSYSASKGGVAALTRTLANEWGGRGVNVNAIAPGSIATDSNAASRGDEARNRGVLGRIPLGRWGTPEDVAAAAVFLCSAAAEYVNGVVMAVDGGWMAR